MLEEKLRNFKTGYRIADDLIHDGLHPENPRQSQRVHDTRVEGGMNIHPRGAYEGMGYLSAVAINFLKDPVGVIKLYKS